MDPGKPVRNEQNPNELSENCKGRVNLRAEPLQLEQTVGA